MTKKSPTSAPASPRPKALSKPLMLVLLLIFAVAMTGCASRSALVVQPSPTQLKAPPPELMQKREPNLRQRLRQLSTESPRTATPPSGN